jgi:hypothetical protein
MEIFHTEKFYKSLLKISRQPEGGKLECLLGQPASIVVHKIFEWLLFTACRPASFISTLKKIIRYGKTDQIRSRDRLQDKYEAPSRVKTRTSQ